MKRLLPVFVLALASGAHAQNTAPDVFANGKNEAKVHVASGFVCPQHIGSFERDAVGETDPETGTSFCAYAALDGVYGTITLMKPDGPYDAKTALAADFSEQEGTGGKMIAEATITLDKKSTLPIYTRTYQTATLEDLSYRVLYTGAMVNGWAVETTIEYADPRDTPEEREFLKAVYSAALLQIAAK